ncbi:hypothetical protein M6B38_381730 [Iris pallida]|uniref:Uncharacterized protein n=1 Tax=Iris pallida TaxID=29817 RepID=A0AAX6G7Z4_IRIPA|nr:hypothetical protein M6B38_381730 [Iris pallida]
MRVESSVCVCRFDRVGCDSYWCRRDLDMDVAYILAVELCQFLPTEVKYYRVVIL